MSGGFNENEMLENKKTFLNNKFVIYGLVLVVALFAIFIILMSLKSNTSMSKDLAYKLVDDYATIFKRENGYKVSVSTRYSDEEYMYSYYDAVDIYFYKTGSENMKDLPEIFIQEYNSNIEADAKIEFLTKRDEKFHAKFDGTIFGVTDDFNNFVIDINYKVFSIENFVIGIKNTYSEDYSLLEEFFENNINGGKKSNANYEEIKEYWDYQIDSLLDLYSEKFNEYVSMINGQVLDYVEKIDNCSTVEKCDELYSDFLKYSEIPELRDAVNQVKEKYSSIIVNIIDFGTLSYDDAQNWCDFNVVNCSIVREYSDTIPEGLLISQSITKDSHILKNDSVRIVYSKGKEPSLEFKNSLKQAENYLRAMPFSYEGLVKQLQFEGYSYAAAVYAVEHCGANWYEQAAKKAQSYLNVMAFSRQGLINQLLFEGFTYDQAEYGVTQVGY